MTNHVSDYLPSWVKTIGIPLILAVLSALISSSFEFSITQNPQIQIVVMEEKNYDKNISNLRTVVQNIGDKHEENILITFNAPFKYSLVSHNSTDSIPVVVDDSEILRVNLNRLAPSSYVILNTEGMFQHDSSKTIVLTTSSKTEFFTLNNVTKNMMVSNIAYLDKINNSLAIEGIAGGIIFVVYRFFLLHRYEFFRKQYLGVYNLTKKRNDPMVYLLSFTLLLFVGLAASLVDFSGNYLATHLPHAYENHLNDSSILPESFLEFKDPKILYPATNGNIILGGCIFFLLLGTQARLRLPTMIWLRPLSLSQIKIGNISGSYSTTKTMSKNTRMRAFGDAQDFCVIKEDEKIIGILSQKEIAKLGWLRTKLGSILQNKKLGSPQWDSEKKVRDNFIVVNESFTLDTVKHEMDEKARQFVIIVDANNDVKGILNYDDIFDSKPSKKNE